MTAEQKLYYEIGKQLITLGRKIMELQQEENGNHSESKNDGKIASFEERATYIIDKLGMPSNLRGYKYTQTAMQLYNKNLAYQVGTTKALYQEIAKRYAETGKKVEKAIRNAISIMWQRGNQEFIKTVFQDAVNPENGRIKNSIFLHTLFDYVSLNVNVM